MSVVVLATLRPAAGRVEEVIAALDASIPAVHQEPGCLLYAAHRAPDDSIVLIEKWESDAAFAAHGDGAARDALRSRLAGLLAAPTEVVVLDALVLGAPDRAAL